MTKRRTLLFLLLAFVLTVGACQLLGLGWSEETQPSQERELLTDDPWPDEPQPFASGLVDSRTVPTPQSDGTTVDFEVNASSAVIALDVLDIRSDEDDALLELHSDFATAARALRAAGEVVLPSVNVLDAKAKQIDDGLMAALELHLVFGADGAGGEIVEFVRALRDAAGVDAHAWLTASLVLAGVDPGDAASQAHVDRFRADTARSNPIGFHEWSPQLEAAFLCLRFLQEPLRKGEPLHDALERALKSANLRARHSRLLNIQRLASNHAALPAIGTGAPTAALLPQRTSRELDLVGRLAAFGAPQGVNLMEQLVLAIRDQRIDLAPTEDGGWYERRAFALEVFLLPERAYEHDKLALSRRYKQRLIEAYKSRMTAVLETQGASFGVASAALPPRGIGPRLRVEPCATYALRLAQSYTFIASVLAEYAPELLERPGLCETGPRAHSLADELAAAQRLFLGVHLVVCEDLGLEPTIAASELSPAEHTAARAAAAEWLATWTDDPDLAVDARLAFPVAFESVRGVRTWCNVGVRAIRLQARFVHAPHVRPAAAPGAAAEPWQPLERWQTQPAQWILLAEEFEELTFDAPQTRAKFRRFLDRR